MTVAHRRIAQDVADESQFTLVAGGPLFQFLKRTSLADEALHRLWHRVACVVAITWLPPAVLSAVAGSLAAPPPSLSLLQDVEFHTRFLVAVPLLLVAEVVAHARLRPLVLQFRDRGLVRADALDTLAAAVRTAHRMRNSVLAELLLLIAVYVTSFIAAQRRYATYYPLSWYSQPDGHGLSAAGLWFVFVSLPFFQFLLARWYFRLLVWAIFLFRAARLPLQLEAIHPDKAGGLGFLGQSLNAFLPLAAAHGVILSGYLGNRIFHAGAKLTDFKVVVFGAVGLLLIAFAGPLLVFAPVLASAKRSGVRAYGRVAQTYVRQFSEKWMHGTRPVRQGILGTGDIQSLADLANSFAVAEGMRLIPVTRQTVLQFVLAALIPLAPLLLTVMPLEKLGSSLLRLVL